MPSPDQSLIEQLRITELELERRWSLFDFTQDDAAFLVRARPYVEPRLDALVTRFYEHLTSIPEIAGLIGDADTLDRLGRAMRRYLVDIFGGVYDLGYVNHRLRIGIVHKRIGVEPKFYLSAVHTLKKMLVELVLEAVPKVLEPSRVVAALQKIVFFDTTLVFDTYISSLLDEIDVERSKSEEYARGLEQKVRERTRQLEELSRTDPLTGLRNVRHLKETLTRVVRAAERRREPVCIAYIDLDGFKEINDRHGHLRGDEILRGFARALARSVRVEDTCFRYGGDEFCVVLPNCTEEDACTILGRRLASRRTENLPPVTFSFGVAQTGPDEFSSPTDLIDRADQRMFEFKRGEYGPQQDDEPETDPPSGARGRAAQRDRA